MRRRKAATSELHLGDAWALGRRYRRLSVRIRKPIAMSVVLAVVVALTGPTAFAEDPITDPNAPATTTESSSPAPDPSPSPAADPITDPSPAPSPEPSTPPATELPSTPTFPEASPEPSPSSVLPVGNPTISSDKDDYPPGDAVILTGTNWQPGELVHIRVNDDAGESWRRDVDVMADGNGTIRDEFQLPDWFVATYTVTASGLISGTATTTFTDANLRFLSSGVSSLGTISWAKYSNNTCTTALSGADTSGSGAITDVDAATLNVAADNGVFVKLTVPANASGKAFQSWTAPSGGGSFTTSDGGRTICAAGDNSSGLRRFTATYATVANVAPVISLPGPALTYAENAAATIIDAGATATDTDSANFDTGTLTIDYSAGGSADDRLAIRNEGTAAGQIGVSGANVTYGGTTIGTFTGGTGTTALVVTFNASSSPAAAQALMRNITYANVSDAPTASRTVRFVLTDGDGGTSNAATKVINVTASNDAPTGADKTITINEDASYTFAAVDFGFSDVDSGDTLSAVRIDTQSLPVGATLKLGTNAVANGDVILTAAIPTLVFTPAANANGTGYASFTFSVRDTGGPAFDASPNTITFNVTAVNDGPVAVDDADATDQDTALIVGAPGVLENDTDAEGDPLSVVMVNGSVLDVGEGITLTSGATLTLNGNGSYDYDPNGAFDGLGEGVTDTDTFTYKANDGALDSNAATVTITITGVNDAPVAGDDDVSGTEDTDKTMTKASLLINDTDADGDNLSLTAVTNPSGGTVDISGSDVIFHPAASLCGENAASFDYTVSDGSLEDTGTVTLDITCVNDAPAGTDNTVTTNEDTDYTFTAADFGFTDPSDTPADELAAVKITTLPADGTLELDGAPVAAGDFIPVADINDGKLTFTPDANENGSGYASFTFQVKDDGGTLNSGVDLDQTANTMTIDVTSVNDEPAGADNTVTTNEDTDYTFTAADFGFSDPNDSPANAFDSVKITTLATNGTIKLNGVAVSAGVFVSKADIDAGKLKFSPDADENGSPYATFTFQVKDDGGILNSGQDTDQSANTMTVNVTAVNDAPVNTVPGAQSTNEDTALTFNTANANKISVADVDIAETAGGKFKVSISVTNGTLTLSGTTGLVFTTGDGTADASMVFTGLPTDVNAALDGLSYAPTADFNGSASLSLTTEDQGNTGSGGNKTDTDTVAITVTAVNDRPVIDSASFGATNVACPTSASPHNARLTVFFHDVDTDDSYTATIDWDINAAGVDDGPFAVTEPSFYRDHSYPAAGSYTARVTVSDGTLTDTKTATVKVDYNTSGILQPVNWTQAHNDPSIFKWGSTVPVKVRFFNCDGTNAGSGLTVKIQVKWISGNTPPVGEFEAITNTNSPDSGGFMRSSGDLYIYNLNTGSLSDKTAEYEITLTVQSTLQTVTTKFGTRAK